MKIDILQGSDEWKLLRKTKITATDASIILGLNPYKNSSQLMEEKLSNELEEEDNEAMKRGRELEPIARQYFIEKTKIHVKPSVHLLDEWIMCSTDGINESGKTVLEIKCGKKAYADASSKYESKRIPDYYYAQIQHILYVTEALRCYYMTFNGFFDITIPVYRDDMFIFSMIEKERKFYEEMIKKQDLIKL